MLYPPNIEYRENFVANPKELFNALLAIEWDKSMKARKTASFGVAYNYSQMSYPQMPMHPLILPIIDSMQDLLGFRFNNCLLNFYENGSSSMGFHSDKQDELVPGTGVAIVSLGAERKLIYRRKSDGSADLPVRADEHPFLLQPGSLLYMSRSVQLEWLHGLLPEPDAGARISLTFRKMRKR